MMDLWYDVLTPPHVANSATHQVCQSRARAEWYLVAPAYSRVLVSVAVREKHTLWHQEEGR